LTLETYLSDIATYLQTLNYGVVGSSTTSTPIQIGGYYESTYNAIFLSSYGGSDPNEIVSTEASSINPDFQILVRHSSQETAISVSASLYRLLRKKVDWTVGTTHFIYVRGKAPPIFVRKTNSNFFEYSINFSASLSD
jgi:Bacteriophage minor capsid protein